MNIPSNSFFVFKFVAELVSFDILAPDRLYEWGFSETEPFNHRFDELGYASYNIFENLESVFFIAALKLESDPSSRITSRRMAR